MFRKDEFDKVTTKTLQLSKTKLVTNLLACFLNQQKEVMKNYNQLIKLIIITSIKTLLIQI